MIRCSTLASLFVFVLPTILYAEENLLVNGGFEQGLEGWAELWTRTPGAGKLRLDTTAPHQGKQAVRIEHRAESDWSFHPHRLCDVEPGDIYRLRAWVRLEGTGQATLSVVLRGEGGRVIEWVYAGDTTAATEDWRQLESRFLIPAGATSIQPRLTGSGPATVRLDDVSLKRSTSVAELRAEALDPNRPVGATSGTLQVAFDVEHATLSITDRRTGHTWRQSPRAGMVVLEAEPVDGGFDVKLLEPARLKEIAARFRLDGGKPELVVELSGEGTMPGRLGYPAPFVTDPGTTLIMPVNEGISYPVDDESLPEMWYHLFGGHGLCMGWYGVTAGHRGLMTLVETPDDAAVRVPRIDGRLCLAPEWLPQRGEFGPPRRLRWVLFDRGGYVAMCKRYREHSRQVGLLRTLDEKRRENPNVDLLVGAVNVWCWDRDAVGICREMQEAGIQRILWSHRNPSEVVEKLNAMGVLTSRYDIYQDAMNPANFPKLRGVHPDWTSDGWPDDLMLDERGDWRRGWRVMGTDGEWYPCGVLCDRRAVEYAKRRVPAELKTHPYRCRFIDTTTASPWRECYHPDHPMTRSESRHWKMELLRYMSEECGLVTGSETGHEAAVPYVHYFEGMMSLGPYRIPDAGRRMAELWDEVPERVAKFQTGHRYRLPLWELVYHDCVVAQWYWGDYNNKLPKLWDRRDLWNLLYGTPPMFMFNRKLWQERRERFVRSYKTAAPVARATGYHEMLSHRWLSDDHAVQETRFANGVTVTVNFGQKPHALADGTLLGPLGYRVEGVEMPQ